jgi:putative membrane protein
MGSASLLIVSKVLAALIAFEHSYFMYFEAFAWTTVGRKTFKHPSLDFSVSTLGLAANQGIYNGLLATGLIFGIAVNSGTVIALFAALAGAAGVFGALTASVRILFIQATPALITAIVAVFAFDGTEPLFVCSPYMSLVGLAVGMVGTAIIGKLCHMKMESDKENAKHNEGAKTLNP